MAWVRSILEPTTPACEFHTPRFDVHCLTPAVTSDAPNALLTNVDAKRVAQGQKLARDQLEATGPAAVLIHSRSHEMKSSRTAIAIAALSMAALPALAAPNDMA